MEFIRNAWTQIRAYLAGLSFSEKAVAVMAVAILLVVGAVVVSWSARSSMVPITAFAADRQAEAAQKLQAAGIQTVVQGGQLLVPEEKQADAIGVLAQSELMSPDTSAAFDQLLSRSSPWDPSAKTAQAYVIAKQKWLAQIIGKMANVRSAAVIISMPENRGFGATHVRPSASVSVVARGDRPVDKALVEAVAGLVSGAVAEMTPQDVVVVDANHGRSLKVGSEDDALPSETLAQVRDVERYYAAKIESLLDYIPGRIVQVSVIADSVRRKQVKQFGYGSEPVKSEFARETERRNQTNGGEAGARPNTTLDIAGGGGSGTFERTSETRTEFGESHLTSEAHIVEAGAPAKQISVTVNVPRSYFAQVFMHGKPADAAPPDDAALQAFADAELAKIESQVAPLINAEAKGVVKAHMIPDRAVLAGVGGAGGAGQAQGVALVMQSAWAKPVGLSVLALLSLGLMLGMVRKATRQPPLPTAQELAGVPPSLPSDDDLVGEAEESDPSMAGVELNEEEIRTRKIAQQIGDMIRAKPEEAVSLVRRWVHTED